MGEFWSRIRQILDIEVLPSQDMTVGTLSLGVLIILAIFPVSKLIQRVIAGAFHARGVQDPGTVGTAKNIAHFVTLVTGLAVGFQAMGFNLTAFLAAGTVLAVALGFAMQNSVQNFVAGFILLTERSITPADILEVQGTVVRVETVGIRSTVARTRDDDELIIPNSILVQSTVTNYTLKDSYFRIRTSVGVSYESDLNLVNETLLTCAKSLEGRSLHRDPVILLQEFGTSSVDFEVSIWVDDPWFSPVNRSKLNFIIWWALKDAGVTIAYPQTDLHIKSGLPFIPPPPHTSE